MRVGEYRIESFLGRGGMAFVYEATDLRLERHVALKVLAPELSQDAEFQQRFLRESRFAASLDHPNIVPIYEAGEASGLLYMAMRHVSGGDLSAFIEREGSLDPELSSRSSLPSRAPWTRPTPQAWCTAM
jgi:serine/threonine protein kinase